MKSGKLEERLKSFLRGELARARKQLEVLPGPSADNPVHEARKAIKKLRAILRLLREMADKKALRRVAVPLREAAHRLGPLRDDIVLRETVHGLKKRGDETLPPHDAPDSVPAVRQARAELRRADEALRRLLASPWDGDGVEAGLRRLYKRGRKAMRRAGKSGADADLHAWRRRAKDLFYALELLAETERARVLVKKLKRLTEWLGDDHDLAFLEQHVASHAGRDEHRALLRRSGGRRRRLQRCAFQLGRRVFHRRAREFVRRVMD